MSGDEFAPALGDGVEEYAEKAAERCTDPRCEHGVPGACPTEPGADVEALVISVARIIHRFDCEWCDECSGPNFNDTKLAREVVEDAVLASDWLAAHTAAARVEERKQIEQEVKRRCWDEPHAVKWSNHGPDPVPTLCEFCAALCDWLRARADSEAQR